MASQMTPLLEIKNLVHAYEGGQKVLKGLNLAVWPGEAIGLAGANGSGKTTFFRCVTGLVKPQSPSIFFENTLTNSEKDFYKLRTKVGYVLQNPEDQLIFPTVGEDLAFGPLNLGHSMSEARIKAQKALEQVDLPGYEDRISWHLSGGEKRLVALAAILSMEPKLLLLDEPLNELDDKASKRVKNVIGGLDCAKIIVSHDREFLAQMCQKIYTLKDGRLN